MTQMKLPMYIDLDQMRKSLEACSDHADLCSMLNSLHSMYILTPMQSHWLISQAMDISKVMLKNDIILGATKELQRLRDRSKPHIPSLSSPTTPHGTQT